jgi:hypothetical protein
MTRHPILLFFMIFLAAIFRAADARAPASQHISNVTPAECERMKARGVLTSGAPVGCELLAIVRFSYIDFDGRIHHDGEIMVMQAAAEFVKTIFDTLYSRRFPIARARLMDHYNGDDTASMLDNNTSGFNHRPVSGGKLPSLHAYGLAIDLNPVQNPYIGFHADGRSVYSPASGAEFANRLNQRPGKPARLGMAEEVVSLFAENGFLVWGGYWDAPIDYQHFQVERGLAEQLAKLPSAQARTVFSNHVANYRTCVRKSKAANGLQAASRKKCIETHQYQ